MPMLTRLRSCDSSLSLTAGVCAGATVAAVSMRASDSSLAADDNVAPSLVAVLALAGDGSARRSDEAALVVCRGAMALGRGEKQSPVAA